MAWHATKGVFRTVSALRHHITKPLCHCSPGSLTQSLCHCVTVSLCHCASGGLCLWGLCHCAGGTEGDSGPGRGGAIAHFLNCFLGTSTASGPCYSAGDRGDKE